jgi:branched-chain amino acid transport system substrate-binding protein
LHPLPVLDRSINLLSIVEIFIVANRIIMEVFMRIFVLLAASLLFAQAALAEPVGSPIPVGIAVGQTTNVALFGEEQVNGAKVAEKMINEKGGVNGTPIKLVFQDTGGDEAGAINAFQNLISRDKVVAIIGPTLSQQAFAADPIANQAKVPVVGPSNTAKGVAQIGEYVSRISAPMTLVAPNALKRALKVNPASRTWPWSTPRMTPSTSPRQAFSRKPSRAWA